MRADAGSAKGINTRASGRAAHAQGENTEASGEKSHAEGFGSTASGDSGSHAEGDGTTASGWRSHAEGLSTRAGGVASHAEGQSTIAQASLSHVEGYKSVAQGSLGAHAEGRDTVALGGSSHTEGNGTTASGLSSHAEGEGTTASGNYSHAEGHTSTADGYISHAEGPFASASRYAQHSKASGRFAVSGDSQTSKCVARRETLDAVATPLTFTGGAPTLTGEATNVWTLSTNRAHKVRIEAIARRTDVEGEAAGFTWEGVVVRDSGSPRIVGAPVEAGWSDLGADPWVMSVAINEDDPANPYLEITGTGETGKTIRWVAGLYVTEVG